jgi:hypothetical protein
MNNTLTLDLVTLDELSTFDMNAILGGNTDPIVVDNGGTGIITAVWFDTGIRP